MRILLVEDDHQLRDSIARGLREASYAVDDAADDYLTKPFDVGELLARLRALTRRRGDALPVGRSSDALALSATASVGALARILDR